MNRPDFRAPPRRRLDMWLYDWGKGTVFLICILLFYITVYIFAAPSKHHGDSNTLADVIVTYDISDEAEFGIAAEMQLKDGTPIMVGTRSFATATEILNQVCLERRLSEAGKRCYKIIRWTNCIEERS